MRLAVGKEEGREGRGRDRGARAEGGQRRTSIFSLPPCVLLDGYHSNWRAASIFWRGEGGLCLSLLLLLCSLLFRLIWPGQDQVCLSPKDPSPVFLVHTYEAGANSNNSNLHFQSQFNR